MSEPRQKRASSGKRRGLGRTPGSLASAGRSSLQPNGAGTRPDDDAGAAAVQGPGGTRIGAASGHGNFGKVRSDEGFRRIAARDLQLDLAAKVAGKSQRHVPSSVADGNPSPGLARQDGPPHISALRPRLKVASKSPNDDVAPPGAQVRGRADPFDPNVPAGRLDHSGPGHGSGAH